MSLFVHGCAIKEAAATLARAAATKALSTEAESLACLTWRGREGIPLAVHVHEGRLSHEGTKKEKGVAGMAPEEVRKRAAAGPTAAWRFRIIQPVTGGVKADKVRNPC